LVVQLGRVEPRYQLALETAAGGRLGQLVVEDDAVAAAGIELLKQNGLDGDVLTPLTKLSHNTSQQLLYAMQMDLLTMPLT